MMGAVVSSIIIRLVEPLKGDPGPNNNTKTAITEADEARKAEEARQREEAAFKEAKEAR